jgi:hypothetical protein
VTVTHNLQRTAAFIRLSIFSIHGGSMKKIMLITFFISNLASANSSFGSQTTSSVTVHDSGYLMVQLDDSSHVESCADSARKNTLILNPGSPNLKEMYSTALAAHMSGKKLSGWVNGCVSFWGRNYQKQQSSQLANKNNKQFI